MTSLDPLLEKNVSGNKHARDFIGGDRKLKGNCHLK